MNRNTLLRITLLVALVSLAKTGYAQALKPGEWRTYTSMRTISDVLIDSAASEIWVGTSGGVFHVPVRSVVRDSVVSYHNSEGLHDNNISALGMTSNGDILIGDSTGGIERIDRATGAIELIGDIAASTQYPLRHISRFLTKDSLVYITTGFGLSIYNSASKYFITTVKQFGSLQQADTVFDICISGGNIYVVLSEGVAVAPLNSQILAAPTAWKIVAAPDTETLRSIAAFGSNIVVGGMRTLYTIASGALAPVAISDTVVALHMRVSAKGDSLFMLDLRKGGRLVSTADLKHFLYYSLPSASGQTPPSCFGISSLGVSVFGFGNNGISVVSPTQTTTGFSPDGPLTNQVADLSYDQSGHTLYAAFNQYGITGFDQSSGSWSLYPADNAVLPKGPAYAYVFWDSIRHVVWIGTSSSGIAGAFSLAPGSPPSVTHFGASQGIPKTFSNEYDIVTGKPNLDNHGDILLPVWAFSGQGLAVSKDGKTFVGRQLDPPDNPYRPFGVAIQDLDDNLFIATPSNVVPAPYGVIGLMRDSSLQYIPGGSSQKLASAIVNALVVDQDNGLWCGTDVGVQVISHAYDYTTGNVTFIPRNLPFLDQQVVHSIAVDGIGNKWVATENGVFIVSPDGTDSLAHYTTQNSPLIDNTVVSVVVDNQTGDAYFATAKGISRTSSIFTQGTPTYANLALYPNPIIQSGDAAVTMTIKGMVQGSTVKVYTVSGRLVSTIDATGFGSTVTWNCRDDNGKLLPSGVYLVGAASPNSSSSGQTKFVLVRR